MRLPMVWGVAADSSAEFLQSLPINLEIVAVDNRDREGPVPGHSRRNHHRSRTGR
jgi:hypothetical protein